MSAREISINLNGSAQVATAEPRVTLLDFLRDKLGFTGTHMGCEHGVCGACSVLVDGVPVRSCLMFAVQAQGREVTTVEGLSSGEELSILQRAFVEHDAQQCGFCTSGMLMSASALLTRRKGKRLARVDVEQALSGNLCRCGTYPHVVSAVLEASDKGGA